MKEITLFELLKQKYQSINENVLYAHILCGEIQVNGIRDKDPKSKYPGDVLISIAKKTKYVSRGGEKLESAISAFGLSCRDKIFIDCGASTGGFTDCLLHQGSKKVYAIDVGHAQFDYRLRHDPRVIVVERTNIMDLAASFFIEPPQAAVIDLSFRSLRRAACHILNLVSGDWIVALAKPQFEWLLPSPSFKGVVRESADRRAIITQLISDLENENVFLQDLCLSPIPGMKGNREYFMLLSLRGSLERHVVLEKIDRVFD
jgi:23S rRNA (cytidine1920-2'-O)/16S rRNA (cytidine1409-2'-O)-methyltransferase